MLKKLYKALSSKGFNQVPGFEEVRIIITFESLKTTKTICKQ